MASSITRSALRPNNKDKSAIIRETRFAGGIFVGRDGLRRASKGTRPRDKKIPLTFQSGGQATQLDWKVVRQEVSKHAMTSETVRGEAKNGLLDVVDLQIFPDDVARVNARLQSV